MSEFGGPRDVMRKPQPTLRESREMAIDAKMETRRRNAQFGVEVEQLINRHGNEEELLRIAEQCGAKREMVNWAQKAMREWAKRDGEITQALDQLSKKTGARTAEAIGRELYIERHGRSPFGRVSTKREGGYLLLQYSDARDFAADTKSEKAVGYMASNWDLPGVGKVHAVLLPPETDVITAHGIYLHERQHLIDSFAWLELGKDARADFKSEIHANIRQGTDALETARRLANYTHLSYQNGGYQATKHAAKALHALQKLEPYLDDQERTLLTYQLFDVPLEKMAKEFDRVRAYHERRTRRRHDAPERIFADQYEFASKFLPSEEGRVKSASDAYTYFLRTKQPNAERAYMAARKKFLPDAVRMTRIAADGHEDGSFRQQLVSDFMKSLDRDPALVAFARDPRLDTKLKEIALMHDADQVDNITNFLHRKLVNVAQHLDPTSIIVLTPVDVAVGQRTMVYQCSVRHQNAVSRFTLHLALDSFT